MEKRPELFISLLLLLFCAASGGFPLGSKIRSMPMKVYPDTKIPDGEYLHYSLYFGGEKDSDYYYVTRKETGNAGSLIYRVFSCTIPVSRGGKPPGDYTKWTSYRVLDPRLGSVTESEENINPEDSKNGPEEGWAM